MYQADIEFGMKQHPWRKVLDQCFVTRRDVYWECGGLREELGHFAEWVLAAAYHARGYASAISRRRASITTISAKSAS